MSCLLVLFVADSMEQFEKVFPSKCGCASAFDRSLVWARHIAGGSCKADGGKEGVGKSNADSKGEVGESGGGGRIVLFCSSAFEPIVRENLERFAADGFCDSDGSGCGAKTESLPKIISENEWNTSLLLDKMALLAKEEGAGFVVYAFASAAFLDAPLSKKLIFSHTEYKAEYTFADGYPFGFAPEIIDAGAVRIMADLAKGISTEQGKARVTKDSVFDVIKRDVNSFEIETEISSVDFRLLRMNFLCDTRIDFLSAKALAAELEKAGLSRLLELDTETVGEKNVIEIARVAEKSSAVLKTLPAFYNVQINCSCKSKPAFLPYAQKFEERYGEDALTTSRRMDYEDFAALIEKIKAFSGSEAVVSLSLWGEALLHPDIELFVKKVLAAGMTVFLDVDGAALPDFVAGEAYKGIRDACKNGGSVGAGGGVAGTGGAGLAGRVVFAVALDAFSKEAFADFHGGASLDEAVDAIKVLAGDFPETYAQFMRTTKNENELEAFYRAWSDKSSATGGKIIIQKYDWFCGALPQIKSADLSPVEREPCWHLRRDIDILFDGSVPLCREVLFDTGENKILGNAFAEGLEEIWLKKNSVLEEHIKKEYGDFCGKCDEFYIFNF